MLHPAHRVGPIAAFEPLYLALAQLQHSQSPSLAETLSDSSPPSLEGDRISLQLGGDIILEHLQRYRLRCAPPLHCRIMKGFLRTVCSAIGRCTRPLASKEGQGWLLPM